MIDPWPVRGTQRLHANKIFSVRADRCADPRDGREHDFYVIDTRDWATVVARDAQGAYILVAQWRFGSQSVSLETPGGIVDDGEDPAAAAARELVEETGYAPGPAGLVSLGIVDPNPGILANRLHVFAAESCTAVAGAAHADATEAIERRLVPPTELDALVARGDITHANVLAALLRYRVLRGA